MKSALRQVKDFIINHIKSWEPCGSMEVLASSVEVWWKLCAALPIPVGCSEQCGLLVIPCKEIEKHFQESNWRKGVMSPN